LTALDAVGPMQNSAASVGFESPLTGGSAAPVAWIALPTTPLSVKHLRNLPIEHVCCDAHVPPGHCAAVLHGRPALVPPLHVVNEAQSAFVEQPANVASGPQNCSNGPPLHSPSFPVVGLHVASLHWFGAVAVPGNVHAPLGHSLVAAQGVPAFVPAMQRLPPQIGPVGPGGSGQSAFVAQGSAAASLQVSQKHASVVNPGA